MSLILTNIANSDQDLTSPTEFRLPLILYSLLFKVNEIVGLYEAFADDPTLKYAYKKSRPFGLPGLRKARMLPGIFL